jgi:hypothetical protein
MHSVKWPSLFYFLASYKLVEESVLPNRNAEIVTHMCKMRLKHFQDEENMIKEEIDGMSQKSSQQAESQRSSQQCYSNQDDSIQKTISLCEDDPSSQQVTKSSKRRLITIDDIEIVKKLPGLIRCLNFHISKYTLGIRSQLKLSLSRHKFGNLGEDQVVY